MPDFELPHSEYAALRQRANDPSRHRKFNFWMAVFLGSLLLCLLLLDFARRNPDLMTPLAYCENSAQVYQDGWKPFSKYPVHTGQAVRLRTPGDSSWHVRTLPLYHSVEDLCNAELSR